MGVYLFSMNDYKLTPHNFDRGLRETLRYKHDFGHADLERAKDVILKAVEHVEHKTRTNSGMSANHLDTAMKYFKEDPTGKAEWKKIPEHQRARVEDALKAHFGLNETETESV